MERIPGESGTATEETARRRGQSEVVGIVLLVGAVLIGATVVVVLGGMLVDDIQSSSEGELARDTAQRAHASLAQAAATGEARSVPDPGDAVDARVVAGGHLDVSMGNGTATCARTVSEDLGAIEYSASGRTYVYEGGAIWAETEAGLTIERHPPITYDDEDGTSISVMAVSATGSRDSAEMVARPDEAERQRISRAINAMLIECSAIGHTDFRINVTSPYASVWEQHFRERVATSPNVTMATGDAWVRATIQNATSAHSAYGLRFDEVTAPTLVDDGDPFELDATLANDGFYETEATIELDVGGGSLTRTTAPITVGANDTPTDSIAISPSALDSQLGPGLHSYDLTLYEDGEVSDATSGSFVLGGANGSVDLLASHSPTTPAGQVDVTGSMVNLGATNVTRDVFVRINDSRVSMSPVEISRVNASHYGGMGNATVSIDVSGLSAGTYRYDVWTNASEEAHGSFQITSGVGDQVAENLSMDVVGYPDRRHPVDDDVSVEVEVRNVGGVSASGTLEFQVGGLPAATHSLTLGAGGTDTVTLDLSASAIDGLASGVVPYNVTLTEDGTTVYENGSIYLGRPGADLGIDATDATVGNDTVDVNATLSNDGVANDSAVATLTVAAADGGVLGSGGQNVSIPFGRSVNISIPLDASQLSGTYTYELAYAGDTETGNFTVGIDSDDTGVSINGAGTGTVTVLGTEVLGGGVWYPITSSVVRTNDTGQYSHAFENTETSLDASEYGDVTNLNTHDTQSATYTWSWNQTANESSNLTVASTIWDSPTTGASGACSGGGYQSVSGEDHARACLLQDPAVAVDASTGDNPSNVRVLLDGDEVPLIPPVLGSQRNTQEVLNDGGVSLNHSTSPPTVELAPNEAVFFFELTDDSATWQDALDNTGRSGQDPDYNDAIVHVEFEPSGNGSVGVSVSVDGGNTLSFTTRGTSGNGSVDVDGTSTDSSGGGSGQEPDTDDANGNSDSTPDNVDVQVDVVTID